MSAPDRLSAPDPSGGPAKVELVGLDHYAVNVTDLQRSADWYRDVLGLRLLHQWRTTWMVGRGNIKVGLFLRPEAERPDVNTARVIQHVAFLVDGDKFSAVVGEIARRVGIPSGEPEDTGIAYSFFVEDPDGHRLEITTYHPAASQPSLSRVLEDQS